MPLPRPLLALALLAGVTSALPAQAALRAAPSSRATTTVTLEYPEGQAPAGAPPVTIRLDYGQPHLRGRALHTDSLVPYDVPWRLGANERTTLVTEAELELGGVALPRGTYVLQALPRRAGWQLIVQRDAGQTPEQGYDAAHDVARIDLRAQPLASPVESLTMWLIPSREPGPAHGELRFAWGATALSTTWRVR